MDTKYKVLIVVAVLATTFAAGRYSVSQTPTVTTVTKVNQDDHKQKDTITDTKTVVVTVKEKTGAIKTVRTTETKTGIQEREQTQTVTDTKQVSTPPRTSTVRLSALAAYKIGDLHPVYGAEISSRIVGPVNLGVFALSNQTIGISVGLDF